MLPTGCPGHPDRRGPPNCQRFDRVDDFVDCRHPQLPQLMGQRTLIDGEHCTINPGDRTFIHLLRRLLEIVLYHTRYRTPRRGSRQVWLRRILKHHGVSQPRPAWPWRCGGCSGRLWALCHRAALIRAGLSASPPGGEQFVVVGVRRRSRRREFTCLPENPFVADGGASTGEAGRLTP
jgi:hypothetical protein